MADDPSPRTRRTLIFAAIVFVLVFAAAGGGWALGATRSDDQRRSDERAASRDRDAAERLENETEQAEDRLDTFSELADKLPPSATGDRFLASKTSIDPIEFGDMHKEDGDAGSVTGARVVDSFTSTNEAEFPGKASKGTRWLVVAGMYSTNKPDEIQDACGTDGFITVVFEDGTTSSADDQVYRGAPDYAGRADCLFDGAKLRKPHPYQSAVTVPEGSTVIGFLVGDTYRRTEFQESQGGAMKQPYGWIELDEPVAMGAAGDDQVEIGDAPEVK